MTNQNQYEPKVKELYDQLQAGVAAISTAEQWKAHLTAMSKFHNYSFGNVMLIFNQFPMASHVASFTTWKNLKRSVKKGERGIKIMAPHTYTVTDPDSGEEKKLTGYHQATVFDISQTDGEPLPTKPAPYSANELTKDTESMRVFYEIIKRMSPVPISDVALPNGVKGRYFRFEERIEIKKGLASHHKCKTAIHEIVHAILHNRNVEGIEKISEEQREIEAEGTAFVVMTYFGMDTSSYSFPYVAIWADTNHVDMIRSAGQIIQRTAHLLIDQLIDAADRFYSEQSQVV